jgi:hypothetical protein
VEDHDGPLPGREPQQRPLDVDVGRHRRPGVASSARALRRRNSARSDRPARRIATLRTQAPGRSYPSTLGQCRSSCTKASWQISSAVSRLPTRR